MMSKHTPGPWRVEIEKEKRFDSRTGEPTHGLTWHKIKDGELSVTCFVETGLGLSDAEKSNIRLIAAAPEMLEALEVVKECLASIDVDVMGRSCRQEFEKAEAYIDDAIAKARGES